MRLPRYSRAAVLITTVVACRSPVPGTLSESARAEITDSIRGIAGIFAQGANALDVDRFVQYFQHPDLTWAGDGQLMLVAPDSVMSFYRAVYRGFAGMDFVWDTIRVSVLDPVTALMAGAGHFAVTDTAGKVTKQGVAVSYVFTRQRGNWELLHGHASHRLLPE